MSHGLTADGQPIYDENEEDIGPLSPNQVRPFQYTIVQLPFFTMTSWFVYMNNNRPNSGKNIFL